MSDGDWVASMNDDGDWVASMNEEERAAWDAFVEHTRRETLTKMAGSAAVISLVPAGGELDVKFAVELGMAIMLEKPLIVVATAGTSIPERLKLVATELVEADIDVEAGQRQLKAALDRVVGER